MLDEGHEVGNRGYSGRAFSAIPANTILSNVMGTSHILHNITGEQYTGHRIQNTSFPPPLFFLFLCVLFEISF